MRLVIDANQVADIVNAGSPRKSRPTLVIAPLIWAEIVNGSRHHLDSRLKALGEYDLLFGMDYAHMCVQLCCLNEHEIREFVPVFAPHTRAHKALLRAFHSPRKEHFQRADELRQNASRERQRLLCWVRQRRKENSDARSRGDALEIEEFATIEEADLRFISGKNARLRTALVAQVTQNNSREIRAASPESLYEAMPANPSIRRFLRLKITFDLAYLDQWGSDTLNAIGDLQAERNDLPDILLALFAREGDTILTNDRRLQTALRHCDPVGKVGVSTWVSHFQRLS